MTWAYYTAFIHRHKESPLRISVRAVSVADARFVLTQPCKRNDHNPRFQSGDILKVEREN